MVGVDVSSSMSQLAARFRSAAACCCATFFMLIGVNSCNDCVIIKHCISVRGEYANHQSMLISRLTSLAGAFSVRADTEAVQLRLADVSGLRQPAESQHARGSVYRASRGARQLSRRPTRPGRRRRPAPSRHRHDTSS